MITLGILLQWCKLFNCVLVKISFSLSLTHTPYAWFRYTHCKYNCEYKIIFVFFPWHFLVDFLVVRGAFFISWESLGNLEVICLANILEYFLNSLWTFQSFIFRVAIASILFFFSLECFITISCPKMCPKCFSSL